MSLTKFKNEFLEKMLQFLWDKWAQLGLHGATIEIDDKVVDPEALLLFTIDLGRFDARLFDEVVDWLTKNGEWINVRRLRAMISKYPGFPKNVLAAICDLMQTYGTPSKWEQLLKYLVKESPSGQAPLFFSSKCKPIPVVGTRDEIFKKYGLLRGKLELRGMPIYINTQTGIIPSMVFKLRSLFGINSRAEIFAYLLTHDEATASRIARDTFYSQKSVSEALSEMAASGIVVSREEGREKPYRINSKDEWMKALDYGSQRRAVWVNWFLVFSALGSIWREISKSGFEEESSYIQSSELRALMREVRKDLDASDIPFNLSDDKSFPGESYLKRFFADIDSVTDRIGFKLPDDREIPKEIWDTMRPMERKMVRKHPYHFYVEAIIQSFEKKLEDDGHLLSKLSPKWGAVEGIRKSSIHTLTWLILRKLKSIVYLCMDDLSQCTFLLCRQILEEYADLHLLCRGSGNIDHKTLGFYVGHYRRIIDSITELKSKYKGRIIEPELRNDINNLNLIIDEILSESSPAKDHPAIKGSWPHKSVMRRLEKVGLDKEYGLIYQYLSLKSHSSYFTIRSRMKLPKLYVNQIRLEIEEDVVEEVIGFAYEIAYRGIKEYLAYMEEENEKYGHPSQIVSEMDRVYEFVNQKSMRLYAKKDLASMGVHGVNLLI